MFDATGFLEPKVKLVIQDTQRKRKKLSRKKRMDHVSNYFVLVYIRFKPYLSLSGKSRSDFKQTTTNEFKWSGVNYFEMIIYFDMILLFSN